MKLQGGYPHGARSVRRGGEQDAALVVCGCVEMDTINMASRMETTAEPMKIHISMETKLLLDTLGRFHTEHRGLVDVKGKGQVRRRLCVEMEEMTVTAAGHLLAAGQGGLGSRDRNEGRILRVLLVSVPTCNRSLIYHNRRV